MIITTWLRDLLRIGTALWLGSDVLSTGRVLLCGEMIVHGPAQIAGLIIRLSASWLVLRAWRVGDLLAFAACLFDLALVGWLIAARYFVVEALELRLLLRVAFPCGVCLWLLSWPEAQRHAYRNRLVHGFLAQSTYWLCGAWSWSMASSALSLALLMAIGQLTVPLPPLLTALRLGIGAAGALGAARALKRADPALIATVFAALALMCVPIAIAELLICKMRSAAAALALRAADSIFFISASLAAFPWHRLGQKNRQQPPS